MECRKELHDGLEKQLKLLAENLFLVKSELKKEQGKNIFAEKRLKKLN